MENFNLTPPSALAQRVSNQDYLWQALGLFNLYRFGLAVACLAITYLHIPFNFLGTYHEPLFRLASNLYFTIALFFMLLLLCYKKYYALQANISVFIDTIAILTIMYASGGIISGIGILLIVVIAAHSLLVPGRLSQLNAAMGVIGLILLQSYSVLQMQSSIHLFTQVGLLGIAIFSTWLLTNLLSIRVRKSQQLVENQAQQLATSQELNAYIVSAMHAGVLILDNRQQIRLINFSAYRLLELDNNKPVKQLADLPPLFQEQMQQWKNGIKLSNVTAEQLESPVRFSFHPLGETLLLGILVFIYDNKQEAQHAQELKLKSLGHLTANIAHELRNPLGSASHAAQLLAEEQYLSPQNHYLIGIIQQSCDRMNTIIQNVLSLSSRKPAKMETIFLLAWLDTFVQEVHLADISQPEIKLVCKQANIEHYTVVIDPTQLRQILLNLCENGLRYSLKKTGVASLTLSIGLNKFSQIVIDVIDQGEGVPASVAKHIFEPFFTTERTGSGLGLYIAKELSQMNGAHLELATYAGGGQFRLTLGQGELP